MRSDQNRGLAAAASAVLTFTVGVLLVIGRGHLKPEITVLVLGLTVVVAGRFGSRPGGLAAALMAATTFDFFHTKPYLSLKIASGDDVAVTLVLLAVGLVAGDLSARALRDRRIATTHELDAEAVSRMLWVAGERSAADVEIAVRHELLQLLTLTDCAFSSAPVDLACLGPNGSVTMPNPVYRDEGFELPAEGVAIAVAAHGQHLGWLVCTPAPGVGVGLTRRKTAVAAAHILGLAMAGEPRQPRRARRP